MKKQKWSEKVGFRTTQCCDAFVLKYFLLIVVEFQQQQTKLNLWSTSMYGVYNTFKEHIAV